MQLHALEPHVRAVATRAATTRAVGLSETAVELTNGPLQAFVGAGNVQLLQA